MKTVNLDIIHTQLQKVQKTYQSFYRAIDEYNHNQSDFIRDSILQRFEYCVEGSRKMGKSILLYELISPDDLLSAGQCIKKMYTHKLIDNIGLRSDLIQARNALSHTYSEDKCQEIFDFIQQHQHIFQYLEERFIYRLQSQHE